MDEDDQRTVTGSRVAPGPDQFRVSANVSTFLIQSRRVYRWTS